MRIALLSDLHANRQAFDACLRHARAQGAEQFALLGDLVGYGGNPGAVLDLAMDLAAQGAFLVRGNHDAMALEPPLQPQTLGEHGALWTHEQLSPPQRAFLAALPLTARPDAQTLLVHASADRPERWHYISDAHAAERSMAAASALDPAIRYVFSGHVHEQALYFLTPTAKLMRFSPQPGVPVPVPPHRQWLAIVGSVGQPRDGDPRACYALFDTQAATLTFQRVPYDHADGGSRATALPPFFADRLEHGE